MGCCFARKGVAVCKTGMLGADVAQPASLFAFANGGDESAVWCLACVRVRRCGRSRGLARMRVAGRIGGRIPAGTACEASSVAANLGVCGHMCPACTVGHCEQRRVAGRPLGCCIQTFASLCFAGRERCFGATRGLCVRVCSRSFERCVALEKLTRQGASRGHATLGLAGNAGDGLLSATRRQAPCQSATLCCASCTDTRSALLSHTFFYASIGTLAGCFA